MKVLMLNYEYPPLGGGAGNATRYLLREFSNYNDLYIDLVTSSVSEFRKEQISERVTSYFLDIKKKNKNLHYQSIKDLLIYSNGAWRFCQKLLRDHSYDFCHAFFGIPGGWIAQRLDLPYIVSLRGSDVPFYNKRFEFLDKFIFQKLSKKIWTHSRHTIANSNDLKSLALKTSPAQIIDVIPNGVDREYFVPAEHKKRGGKIRLITVGRLIQRKGYEFLIRALSNDADFHLTIIGDGNLRGRLISIMRECDSQVTFLGKKDHSEIKRHLQESDIYISVSLTEGMSNSLLEAMACGLPIITTNVGGVTEFMKGNGYIIQKASKDNIVSALNYYRSNWGLIDEHGVNSRRLSEAITWEKVARAYFDVYNSIKR